MSHAAGAGRADVGAGLTAGRGVLAAPFVASAFLGALLIFLVQPMFARMATPLLGGAPAVWNVSLVCFQAALLAGYAYAHGLARVKSARVQMMVHAVVLALGLLCLPLRISGLFGEPDAEAPILWLIGTFAVSIAPPFAALSATAPLVQHWYSRSGRADADNPWHLYAASNIGSMIGLAAYPLLLEPFARLREQALVWMAGYGAVFVLLMACAWLVSRHAARHPIEIRQEAAAAPVSWRTRAIWLALAFAPSSLLVGATTHITTDIAAAPFLWAPPLMAYLLTFVIVFSKKPVIPHNLAVILAVLATGLVAPTLSELAPKSWPLALSADLLALFFLSLAAHGELNRRRPDASRLTEFYLIMSLGGVLGGAFNALLAPVLFEQVIEYPLMIFVTLLLLATPENRPESRMLRFLVGAIIAAGAAWIMKLSGVHLPGWAKLCLFSAPLAAIVVSMRAPLSAAGAFLCAVLTGAAFVELPPESSKRSFFGVVKVVNVPGDDYRIMLHGTTMHGAQWLHGDRLRPLTYYAPATPIGQVFTSYGVDARSVGVVGLGLGSVACYRRPGQDWTFYEIDPLVAQTAADSSRFTFMSDCGQGAPVVLGDARVKLAGLPKQPTYDLLLLDAFSSDAVPAHLMTREAVGLYLDLLTDDGVLVFHVSNRHLALDRVLARVAAAQGVTAIYQHFTPQTDTGEMFTASASEVVMMARSPAALERALATGKWVKLEADSQRPWTDDYSNVIGAMIDRAAR